MGSYAGWGSGEEAKEPPAKERTGPAMMPFLRYRASDRWWKLGMWWLWAPAIVVLITVEEWLHIPQAITWISLGVLLVVYVAGIVLLDRLT